MRELSKGYLLLFNTMTGIIEDIRDLQAYVTLVDQTVQAMSQTGKLEDSLEAITILARVTSAMGPELQKIQLSMIQAQQEAEALYIEGK